MKSQKGFAVFEALLVLVIAVVIGGIGWYAIHTKHQTDRILSQADKISKNTTTAASYLADNQSLISGLIVSKCNERGSTSSPEELGLALGKIWESNKPSLVINGAYARAAATCDASVNQSGRGDFTVWLRKINGYWQIVSQGQQSPDCKLVDNQSWPNSVLSACYDSVSQTERSPK